MVQNDAVSTVAMLAIMAFAIDRIVNGFLFLLSFNASWNRSFPEPALKKSAADRFSAGKKQKLIYFVFAGTLTVGLLAFADQVRVLTALGFRSIQAVKPAPSPSPTPTGSPSSSPPPTPSPTPPVFPTPTPDPARIDYEPTVPFRIVDFVITALILVGGADRIERLLKGPGAIGEGHHDSEAQPLEIKGKITLEDQSGGKIKEE